jgi:phosphoglycerate dehydrogenase-like enzyme
MTPPRSPDERRPLRTIVIAMGIADSALTQLRAQFPNIRFIVPGEEQSAADERYRIAPTAPSAAELSEADALIGWELDAEMLAAAPKLRWMHAASAGVEHFDLSAIAARGVLLTNSRGVFAPNIAEHVLAMMLALTRRLPRLLRAQAEREWRDWETHREVGELHGQSLLIVGLGEIGRAVAERAAAFGMRVSGLRLRPDGSLPPGVSAVFESASLPTVLPEADYVVVTLPGTPRTRGLFDAAAFAAMKPGAVIYNVGRGAVIDTPALIAALASGHLGGAGLDVTEPEPLPADSPLWGMENVLITCHTSGATPHYWTRQGALISDNIGRFQRGEALRNLVDLEAGY